LDAPQLHIFVDEVTQRLLFTMNLIFKDRGIRYTFVNDPIDFRRSQLPKFVYSDYYFEEQFLQFSPADLVFEHDISPVWPTQCNWNEIEVLSFRQKPDIFASVFYVASLYHEYTYEKRDKHQRIPAKNSFLDQQGWLNQVVVDRWATQLIALIEEKLKIKLKQQHIPFSIVPTFDIDHAFAYKYKSGWRRAISRLKDLLTYDKTRIYERKQVESGEIQDPYDTFEEILAIGRAGFTVRVFWLLGDYAEFDRNLPHNNAAHKRLIQKMANAVHVGLHPSYASNESLGKLQIEKQRLESIVNKNVTISRQHYLKLEHGKTWRELVKAGFTDDYTLGFADQPGFRAGLSRPFPWFDLKKNRITDLTLHPITYMDGTLNEYMGLSIAEAIGVVDNLMQEVRTYGGEFISLWHNETIGNYGIWKGWREVLDHTLNSK
jgi:hypothetical protein